MSSARTSAPHADYRTEACGAQGMLLENMSARPRTPIVRTIPAVRGRWVAFAIPPEELSGGRLKIPSALARQIEERWEQLGFTGATLLRPVGPLEAAGLRPEICTDRLLTLNIMLRARGRLLLEGVPPLEALRADETVAVATDDPLLVRAAVPELRETIPTATGDTPGEASETAGKDRAAAEAAARAGGLRFPQKLRQVGQR